MSVTGDNAPKVPSGVLTKVVGRRIVDKRPVGYTPDKGADLRHDILHKQKADQQFHRQKCIMGKAAKMLDPHQCAAYRFAKLAMADPTSTVTYDSVLQHCTYDIARVTPAELSELCTNISGAYEQSSLIQKWE
jgi:hypothetical protein